MKKAYVYKITSPSGRVYIGSTNNVERRKREYRRVNLTKQLKLRNSFKKYGFDKHTFEVIHECTVDTAFNFEYYYGTLYNVLSPENLNCRLPKIDDTSRAMSEETKRKIGNANRGGKRPLLTLRNQQSKGQKASESLKEKFKAAQSGRKHPQKIKDKIRNAHIGKIKTAEHCKKISLSKINSANKPVLFLDTGEVWHQGKELSLHLGMREYYVSRQIKYYNSKRFTYVQSCPVYQLHFRMLGRSGS